MSARKVSKGFFGPNTRVLVCADYKPGKPTSRQLQVRLDYVKIGEPEFATIYDKQGGNCLCHGTPKDSADLKCLEAVPA